MTGETERVDAIASIGAVLGIFGASFLAFSLLTREQEFLYMGMLVLGLVAGTVLFGALGRALVRR